MIIFRVLEGAPTSPASPEECTEYPLSFHTRTDIASLNVCLLLEKSRFSGLRIKRKGKERIIVCPQLILWNRLFTLLKIDNHSLKTSYMETVD